MDVLKAANPFNVVQSIMLIGNVEAMTSKGLRSSCLSKYTETRASCNV